jgi:hypothetical protein
VGWIDTPPIYETHFIFAIEILMLIWYLYTDSDIYMDKERMLGMPKKILAKATEFAERKSGSYSIVGGTAGIGLAITDAVVLGGNLSHDIAGVGFGIVAIGVGIIVDKAMRRDISSINNRLNNMLQR